MIQDIGQKKFDNQYKNAVPQTRDCVLIFKGEDKASHSILLKTDEKGLSFPTASELNINVQLQYLFSIDEKQYFLYMGPEIKELEGYRYELIRFMRGCGPMDEVLAGMTGYHLYQWYKDNKYCGRCGKPMVHSKKLRMLSCSCGNMVFPRLNPAVIIGVIKGDQLLLSRYAGRAYKGRALLAGFCEIGESAEETVRREVMEEVGLHVKNIRYFASQPWGLEMDLLLGYFADADGDEAIRRQEDELASAQFVSRSDIEKDDNLMTLTATMIEAFRRGEV